MDALADALFALAFPQVVTSGKMLGTFGQVGAAGRKSRGSRQKAMVQGWLNGVSDAQPMAAVVGNDTALRDALLDAMEVSVSNVPVLRRTIGLSKWWAILESNQA